MACGFSLNPHASESYLENPMDLRYDESQPRYPYW